MNPSTPSNPVGQNADASLAAAIRAIMQEHEMPPRLIPDSVQSFAYDRSTGMFKVELIAEVNTEFDRTPVHYKRTISGRLKKGAIEELAGVKAKEFFWVPITGILREGADLAFQVGPLKKRLALHFFS